jgi:hypothetical protein
MSEHFFYDTHYQLDKPFALIDVTLAAASPTKAASDNALARRLEDRATSKRVAFVGANSEWVTSEEPWKINKDAFIYWIGNCQQSLLLSRQNSYDYWLINFAWARCFDGSKNAWGALDQTRGRFAQLLLWRWAWLHDGPMLAAVLWYLSTARPKDKQALYEDGSGAAEDTIIAVLAALREATQDIRLQTNYRKRIEELKDGFKYNTRRHKLATHLALLLEAGIIGYSQTGFQLPDALRELFAEYKSIGDAVRDSLRRSAIGDGGDLFLRINGAVLGTRPSTVGDLGEEDWGELLTRIRADLWPGIVAWDRKFLGIDELAEFFLVESLDKAGKLWSIESWKQFLLDRSRRYPDELTIHVGRFGEVKYLRLA